MLCRYLDTDDDGAGLLIQSFVAPAWVQPRQLGRQPACITQSLHCCGINVCHGPVVLPVPDGVVQGQPGVLIHPRVPRPEVMVMD